jgi:hypothetical protein
VVGDTGDGGWKWLPHRPARQWLVGVSPLKASQPCGRTSLPGSAGTFKPTRQFLKIDPAARTSSVFCLRQISSKFAFPTS